MVLAPATLQPNYDDATLTVQSDHAAGLSLLGACLAVAVVLCPWATATALHIAME